MGGQRGGAFSGWLRTGLWSPQRANAIEYKFNPYHDPRNGQFTFAPGGPRSLSRVIISDRRWRERDRRAIVADGDTATTVDKDADRVAPPTAREAVYRPDKDSAAPTAAAFSPDPRARRGSNIRAFQDPMTLQQVFPGLQGTPGGAIIALADNVFDFAGPARELTAELTRNWSNRLIGQIQAIDPSYRFQSLGVPQTLQGQVNQIDGLRFDRATAFMRQAAELQPLQVETLRFVQKQTDLAYAGGMTLLRSGRLRIRLSEREALGNYIDRRVRQELRKRYNIAGIDAAGKGPIRVNRRENNSSGTEITFRQPDARVGNVAYDVTLSPKDMKTRQVRGFFNTDFQPSHVVIIRPSAIGAGHTYIISKPEPTP